MHDVTTRRSLSTVYSISSELVRYNCRAEKRGKYSRCVVISRGYVCMYEYPQIAQCNSMLVYVHPQHLRNKSYARVCMSVACATIAQFSNQNVPGDDYGPRLLPGLCGLYLMEEHNHKCFKSLPHSLHIAYDFSDALKTHLNVCRVCCPFNDQIR